MFCLLLLLLITIIPQTTPETTAPQNNQADSDTRARALIETAVKAMGGPAYLNVKSERSRGYITPYKETQPEKLGTQSFTDYILLPDKERVEFKGQGRRFIQSNAGEYHWIYDSDSQTLKDQTPAQRQRFTKGLRYQLDQILRGGWYASGIKLSYLARQEIWPRQYAEGVRITFPDNEEVSLYFDPQTTLPLALRFPTENDKGERAVRENRFLKYIETAGITSPRVVDLFEGNQQILRINYEERDYNAVIPEKLFIKPENIKAIK
jgi:hypothetical protein